MTNFLYNVTSSLLTEIIVLVYIFTFKVLGRKLSSYKIQTVGNNLFDCYGSARVCYERVPLEVT